MFQTSQEFLVNFGDFSAFALSGRPSDSLLEASSELVSHLEEE
jgi:hypothetical protein